MLREDPKLPFLAMAWSPDQMGDFFNSEVIPKLCPGRVAATVAIRDMTYKPGRQCVILYEIGFSHPQETQLVVVTFAKDDKLQFGHTTDGSALFLAEFRCLVELFPTDCKLPCLAEAINGGPMTVLQYRPHQRCVIRFTPRSPNGDGSPEVIGKFYSEGPKAARAWHAQTSLYEQATENLAIPKPLALTSARNLVLMECVRGMPMNEILDKSATGLGPAKEATGLIARALAALHRMRYQSEQVRTVESQVQVFRDRAANLHLVAPRLAGQVDALLHRTATISLRFKSEPLLCIHGECKASQFLVSHGQIAIVDFDRVCLGDRSLDVGNFMANLHREAVKGREHFRDLASHFLAEYLEHSSGNVPVERTHLFRAASLVRMAVRAFTRMPHAYSCAGPDSLPVLLLQEATACLAAL